jgi:hypothetical protein
LRACSVCRALAVPFCLSCSSCPVLFRLSRSGCPLFVACKCIDA